MENIFEDELRKLEIIALNEKAENAIAVAAVTAATTGAVPIPFPDAPFLILEQVGLMAAICDIYKIDASTDCLRMLATSAIAAGGSTLVGKTVFAELLKLIPGAGSVVRSIISAGTAGVVTLIMGKLFIEVCKMLKVGRLREADLTQETGKLKTVFHNLRGFGKNGSVYNSSFLHFS